MTTTSKRKSGRSRSRLSGFMDVLLGRVPARNAGFFQRPQADADADSTSPAAGSAEQATTGQPSTGQPSTGQSSSGQSSTEPSAPTTDHADAGSTEGGAGLRVQTDRLSVDENLGVGAVDGAWWPRGDVAADEVAELARNLPTETSGHLTRVALSMSDWSEDRPRLVQIDDHPVHLEWFTGMRRHTAHVTFEDDSTVLLLVLPPSTDESDAREVLGAVSEERSRKELLSRVGIDLDSEDAHAGADEAEAAQNGQPAESELQPQDDQQSDGQAAGAV